MLRLLLGTLVFLTGCAGFGPAPSPLDAVLSERFGAARTESDTVVRKLTIRLTDSRWEGMEDVVEDSGKVVGRFALEHLPEGMARPHLVEVHFQVERSYFGLFGATSGIGLAADSL